MAPIIELRNVYKRFGDNVIYEDMSFAVEAGETFTIIGGSGMGKSVCLKLMIGLLPYDAGHVLYRGKEVGDMDAENLRELRRNVAMVFQGGALFDSMSVFDNVTYALREHTKMSDQEMLERAGSASTWWVSGTTRTSSIGCPPALAAACASAPRSRDRSPSSPR
ncbi:ATP-binding cassette domain-containing protein [Nannocystis pusilla]|uniref:ATP-binding cassette domain-containing protein n=1 Tax=Nannocystis pusilla TaxID=889268 RepID=UPI003B826D78